MNYIKEQLYNKVVDFSTYNLNEMALLTGCFAALCSMTPKDRNPHDMVHAFVRRNLQRVESSNTNNSF